MTTDEITMPFSHEVRPDASRMVKATFNDPTKKGLA
jgi:hypothetical protein